MTSLQDKAMQEWKKNVAFFEAHKDEIRKQYGENTHVVVKDQRIIGGGGDRIALVKKYAEKYGEEANFIVQSVADSERVIEVPYSDF